MRGRPNTHTLYRMYDVDGMLLYVGLTNDPAGRFRGHSAKDWWEEVASITLEHHCDREDLKFAELEAIETEFPLYNRAHNTSPAGVQTTPTGPVCVPVIVEYDGPEEVLTPEQIAEDRAAADLMDRILGGQR